VGKAKRAHHPLVTHGIMLRMGGGHAASAPLPTLRAIVIARSTCDEAIQSCFARHSGLLRGACHRAAFRADPLARNDGIQSP
jgi:hypothetical protein